MERSGEALATAHVEPVAGAGEAKPPGPKRSEERWRDVAAGSAIVAVALVMTWQTWARWGDIQIDCGKEIYVPVEILRGKLLYWDVWYPYGPLTPYLQALLVAVFGRHLSVFYWFGIALATGSALLLYRIGAELERHAAGFVAALALLFFAFGPTEFNYPFPYTYAAPVALLLDLVCGWLTARYLLEPAHRSLVPAGIAAGLALLSKPEIAAASWLMLGFAVVMQCVVERSLRRAFARAAECVPGILICTGVYAWFCWKLGVHFVLYDNLHAMPGSYFARTYGPYQAAVNGLRLVPAELAFLIITDIIALLFWFLVAKAAHRGGDRVSGWLFALWAALLLTLVAVARYTAAPGHVGYLLLALTLVFPPGMYFIGCGFLVYTLRALFAQRSRQALAESAFAFFALVLAVRALAQVMRSGFSIFYAAPLVLIFLMVLVGIFTAAGSGLTALRKRELVNVLLALELGLLAIVLIPGASGRTAPFETSWGTIYLSPQEAATARQILDFISEKSQTGNRIVIFPELTAMYAFAQIQAPSRWYAFVPGNLTSEQESGYIAELERRAPDYVLLSNERTVGYQSPYFGIDYNREVYRWIEDNYRMAGQFGDFKREKGAPLAALLYERRNLPAESAPSAR